jgi:hypothetical protein
MTELPAGVRICTRTGLALVEAAALQQPTYRVAGQSWGALNPVRRPAAPSEVDNGWGRFDTLGGRTVYAADTRQAALAEVLGYFRLQVGERSALEKDAAFLGLTAEELRHLVDEEWRRSGHMPPGQIARGWRVTRRMHTLTMPADGQWILLDNLATLGAIERALPELLKVHGIGALTLSELTADRREVTVRIATWARDLTMDDGQPAHGVVFPSKHGGARGYAYWLRRIDDGEPPAAEPLRADEGAEIAERDPDLVAVARRFGIRVH